jgi:hypothetical protein
MKLRMPDSPNATPAATPANPTHLPMAGVVPTTPYSTPSRRGYDATPAKLRVPSEGLSTQVPGRWVLSEVRMRVSAQGPSGRCERGAPTTTRRGGGEACGVAEGGGTTVACDSLNTKLLELRFRAVLSNAVREVRIERMPG